MPACAIPVNAVLRVCPIRRTIGCDKRSIGMRMNHYPSDITDSQWALIEPHMPPEPGGGRPRKTDVRDVLDAILYILRTGCQWRVSAHRFPAQEHRLALLRPVASGWDVGPDP